jgi:hypothetical protein
MKRIFGLLLLVGLVLILLIQLVPYGHDHNNPPVVQEPQWSSAEARVIAQRACYDCHSNETTWPWYSNVAPVSWLVQHDVDEGRSELNFSEWGQGEQEVEEAGEKIREGEMPPRNFLITHPEARLTGEEKNALILALSALGGEGEE